MKNQKNRKVLLIGWDAADWKVINPLLDSGQMPALERLVNKGVIGNIATLNPPLSPMLWTSIATGKHADKHGILGFVEPDVDKGSIRPVNSTSRKVKAIWNILHNQGLKSNVVGWWPSQPVEPINGVMVSNFFHNVNAPIRKPWKILKNSVHPMEMEKEIKDLRVHIAEITEAHLLPFVPKAGEIDQDKDKRLVSLAKIISEAASIQAISTWLMENTEWDFMAVYFDAIDHFCHGFMKFHPPHMNGIPDDMFEMYKGVVNGGYIFHDMMLDRMLDLAGEDTTIILVSDHGFHSDHLRPLYLPKLPAAPALEHNPYGVICMAGDGIKKDERIYGATIMDITPTILSLFGLPIGEDMDGKVLTNAFEKYAPLKTIESWEKVDGDFGTHPKHLQEDAFASSEAMQQLVDLGYIEDPGEDKKKAIETSVREAKYNLSVVYASKRKYTEAIEILEELFKENDKDIRFNLNLADCYLKTKRFDEAKKIITNLRTIDEKAIPNIDLMEGILFSHRNMPAKALEFFKKAEQSNGRLPGIHIELGKVYLKTQRYKDALQAFEKAIKIDDGNAISYHGIALSYLRLGNYEEAVENLLTAIGLMFHFPQAHYHLGESLYKLGLFKEASDAFEVCLKQAPGINKARRWLVKIYSENIDNKDKSGFHNEILMKQMKGRMTIVSGLPRSGTSMMMQILKAGGMEILTDGARKADSNNPKGYFEVEAIKRLSKDNSCLKEADGKVVKVIAQLLQFLPSDYEYDIVFMNRNMNEILKSQQVMIGKDPNVFPSRIAEVFKKELEKVSAWSEKEPNVRMLNINYNEVIENPAGQIEKINEFFNFILDETEMTKQVDKELYRNKVK